MKAVQMIAEGSPDVLQYVDIEMPVPGNRQVRVKGKSNLISINVCIYPKLMKHMP
jgi:NADPH:quinone reductase-like Zn-dependent oxidoreductase